MVVPESRKTLQVSETSVRVVVTTRRAWWTPAVRRFTPRAAR